MKTHEILQEMSVERALRIADAGTRADDPMCVLAAEVRKLREEIRMLDLNLAVNRATQLGSLHIPANEG